MIAISKDHLKKLKALEKTAEKNLEEVREAIAAEEALIASEKKPVKKVSPKKPTHGLNIAPHPEPGNSRTGSLSGMSVAKINQILDFKPNVDDDPCKVKHSWGFKVNGKACGVWDYKGSGRGGDFSTDGPSELLSQLFGENYRTG